MTALPARVAPNLRAPGAVLLLSCYESGHAPLALASPAAFLEAAGFRPALQDLAVERLDPETVRRASVVCIAVPMHTALRLGLQVAGRVRALNPGAHLCAYGLYAGLNAARLLDGAVNSMDSVIGGEYEPPLVALVEALQQGADGPVAGVSTAHHPQPTRLARTDFPVPSRAALRPLSDYAHLQHGGQARTVGYVEASRGCKHTCLHCPITPVYAGRFFVVPAAVVLRDIDALVAQGAQHITFGDPDFLNGPGHALKLVRALHQRHPQLTYDATIKVEHLLRHRSLLPELARTGCLFIVTAAESLSDTLLAYLDKGHTRADVQEAIQAVRDAGIAPRPTWVPFTPWTTLGDYLELLEFIWREGLAYHVDPVQYAIRLLVPPGSALLDALAFAPFRGPLDPDALTHPWRHPDPRLDALQTRVASLVEAAAANGEDAAETLRAVHSAAVEAQRGPSSIRDPEPPRSLPEGLAHPIAPRLSEPWFC